MRLGRYMLWECGRRDERLTEVAGFTSACLQILQVRLERSGRIGGDRERANDIRRFAPKYYTVVEILCA